MLILFLYDIEFGCKDMKKRKNIQYLKIGNLAHIAAAFGEKLKDS